MYRPATMRPRLADHVLARRYLAGDREHVVLIDQRSGRRVQLGPREWGIIACADGTRDLEGIALAAAREGAHARLATVEAFFAQLNTAGLLSDDPLPSPGEGGRDTITDEAFIPPDRPLAPLPGFSLHCDGRGSCCRLYITIAMSPLEAARARSLLPHVLGGGDRHERAFTPERGSAPCGGSAVALVDGRCAYLGDDGRCGVHARGGADQKPLGCAAYPAIFVDDGESIRVSINVECACVAASAGRSDGAPLLPEGAKVRADLDPALVIDRIPDHLVVHAGDLRPRADLFAWERAIAARLPFHDTARAMWSIAGALERGSLGVPADLDARPDPKAIAARVRALGERAKHRVREDASFRSKSDLALRAARWIAETCELLLAAGVLDALLDTPSLAPEVEELVVRAALHGHTLISRGPVAEGLYDRAVRLYVGRALPALFARLPEGDLDPACDQPIALVEAVARGYALTSELSSGISGRP